MKKFLTKAIGALLLTSSLLAEHPGKAPYQLYCGACHAPDGNGINGGQFPPLAKSEWVGGKPERMIEIVLHGLQGPLEVNGRAYNLAMPPHKDALKDEQIADIVSYVRNSWGNKGTAVTSSQIAAMRKATSGRNEMWNAPELLKKYPIERPPAIRDLLSYTHLGKFKSLADLRKSKAANAEEEKKGLISLKQAALKSDKRDHYGMVWEGWLNVPRDGKYTFHLDTDDGGSLAINGKEIITRDRIGAAGEPSKKSIELKQGRAEMRVDYFELAGQEFISLAWEGPGMKKQLLSDTHTAGKKAGKPPVSIPITPPAGEAIIYRNFIKGTDPRAIGVGYSEGVNLAFSADSMSLDLLWTGLFMDGGRHWVDRGKGSQPPSGEQIITVNQGLPFALLDSQSSPWPKKAHPQLKPTFRGYRLNKKQQPTFHYQFGTIKVVDFAAPITNGLTRSITLDVPSPGSPSDQLYFRALSKGSLKSQGERSFDFNDELSVEISSSEQPPITRDQELLIPIPLTPGKHRIQINYTWK